MGGWTKGSAQTLQEGEGGNSSPVAERSNEVHRKENYVVKDVEERNIERY